MARLKDLIQPNKFRHLEDWDRTGSAVLVRRRQYVEDFIAHFSTQHALALGPMIGVAASDTASIAVALGTVFPPRFRERLARSLVTVRDEDLPICMDTALWGELRGYFGRHGGRA